MRNDIAGKLECLRDQLSSTGSLLLAFSGGVDSSLLLRITKDAGLTRLIAATIDSPLVTTPELEQARKTAALLDVEHVVVAVDELLEPEFTANPAERCYHCKKLRYRKLAALRERLGIDVLADGSIADDHKDWRPGLRAARELGVISPLADCGFTKEDVRKLARELGLTNWSSPSNACLASRLPYRQVITLEKLTQIEQAEAYMRALGFTDVRVRHHGDTARIEVPLKELGDATAKAGAISVALKELGFLYVSLDLAGLKNGNLNLSLKDRQSNNS